EDHPLPSEGVYGLSQQIGEQIAQSYRRKGLGNIMLRRSGVVTPAGLAQIKKWAGGRLPGLRPVVRVMARTAPAPFPCQWSGRRQAAPRCSSTPMIAP